jgi:hypothetical protein
MTHIANIVGSKYQRQILGSKAREISRQTHANVLKKELRVNVVIEKG